MWQALLTELVELFRDVRTALALISQLQKEIRKMALTLDDVLAETQKQTTLIGSLQTFVQGLKDQIAAAGTDPVKLQAIQDALSKNDDAITAITTGPTGAPVTAPTVTP